MKIKEFSDSCRQAIKSHPKQTIAIAVSVVVIIVLICLLSLRSCSNTEPVEPAIIQAAESLSETTSSPTKSQKSTESPTASSIASSPTEEATIQSEQMASVEAQSDAAQSDAAQTSDSGQQSNLATANTDEGATATTPPNSSPAPSAPSSGESENTAPSKTWVVDYEQTWVQDSAAWDESIPTYGYKEKSICNVCGAEITGNETAHGKAHMMAGEGSGHHTEMIQVVTGCQTVRHDATGHYDTVESGGHWE